MVRLLALHTPVFECKHAVSTPTSAGCPGLASLSLSHTAQRCRQLISDGNGKQLLSSLLLVAPIQPWPAAVQPVCRCTTQRCSSRLPHQAGKGTLRLSARQHRCIMSDAGHLEAVHSGVVGCGEGTCAGALEQLQLTLVGRDHCHAAAQRAVRLQTCAHSAQQLCVRRELLSRPPICNAGCQAVSALPLAQKLVPKQEPYGRMSSPSGP